MAEIKLPKRSEVPEEYTWDLTHVFSCDADWATENEALAQKAAELQAFQGRLADRADTLLAYFRLRDETHRRLNMLCGYASCKADQDAANSYYKDMDGKASSTATVLAGARSFAVPEILNIPEDILEGFFTEQPELEQYRRDVELIRRDAAHILSPAEEKLLAASAEIARGANDIGATFRNADLKFPPAEDSSGKSYAVTSGTLVPLLQSTDGELRRSAFNSCYGQYDKYKNTVAAILDAEFRTRRFYAEARRYPDMLTAALDGNEVPTAVYTNLIEAVHANLDKMYRYVALRKKLLGVNELHMYDVYTPIAPESNKVISYEEAKQTVLESLQVLGKDYQEMLKKGFNERWIDVYENEGKRSGAYSSGLCYPHPYVLLNHKDNLDCMFTLAHEMGHTLHTCYSAANQPVNTADYVIFVAEVASTCNEVLMMRYLLQKTSDRKERAALINYFLEQFKGTVYRQTMFAEFEMQMGCMCEAGETLTAEALQKKYLELNKLYFGPDMISDDYIGLEWARIPHFFYNYYVFQYATGFSAAVAIANRILSEGAPAVEDYKRFLSGGSSTDPISLLKIAGVDMSTPEPVNSALQLFGELVDEMAELVE